MAPLPSPCTCGAADVPQLAPVVVRMYQPDPDTPALRSRVLDMFPSPEQLATMLFDVMEALGWRETYMLYNKRSEFYSCFKAMLNEAASRMFYLWSQDVPPDKEDGDALGAILHDVSTSGRKNVLLMTSADVVAVILDKATEMLLLTSESHWIVTSVDVRESQLQSARHSGALLTLLRPFPETPPPWGRDAPDEQLSYRTRLALDAVKLVSSLSPDLVTGYSRRSDREGSLYPREGDCGAGMTDYISEYSFLGFSGHVSFDSCGKRKIVTVFVDEYLQGESKQVGTWTTEGTTEIQSGWQKPTETHLLSGRHLLVYTALSKPFFMKKPGKSGEVGSTPYHGYHLDLLEMLASHLNFTWNITRIGSRNREIVADAAKSKKYDLLLVAMAMRTGFTGWENIEYSIPIRTRGYFLTMKKSNRHEGQGIFQFMGPFSAEVWLSFAAAVVGVSFALAVNGRLNPCEWAQAASRGEVSVDSGHLSLVNSLWSTFGAALYQGHEFLPRSSTGRVIVGAWWFVILVMVASYTANLAAFLSRPSAERSIRSLVDLARQTDVPYGTYKGYTFVKFLKKSQEEPFKTIGRYLNKNSDEVLFNTSRQALERAAKGDFIFISPTTYEYEILKDRCDMVILTDEYFFKYQVALPFPVGSPYRAEINQALMKMTEDGQMDALVNRWFNKKKYKCSTGSSDEGVLDMEHLDGTFYYLMIGMGTSILVFALEWVHFKFKKGRSSDPVNTGDRV
ncbi:probable glutamate receptor [Branchiostoma floridae]|uniref:Probable glutamate receptor n=1 Tax=Branchiostoma floridae TaxID=7739 RepID=A0A9J7MEW8_BRAFL|nr:probable glutamate receptor [Branchiostoma floridae]